MELKPVLAAVLEGYVLPLAGSHGVPHWARVLENGLRLAAETGADLRVVSLFAVLHDARRFNEGHDPDHGPRAARWLKTIRGRVFDLDDAAFATLRQACAGHTHERTHADITVQTCYDADRLDLGRVGIEPHPDYLSTAAARRRETIRWADGRASMNFLPVRVRDDWGIDLAGSP